MATLFNTTLYQPLLNLAVVLYALIPGGDFGLAIVVLTVLIRIILLPLSVKMARSQRVLQRLQPRIQELQEKLKHDKTAQTNAIMALYREHRINPITSLAPMLVQLPILVALYQVFINIFKPGTLELLYDFVPHPAAINTMFLGLLDISTNNKYLAIAAGIVQFAQSKTAQWTSVSAGQKNPGTALNAQLLYFLPIMIIIIGWNLPAGLTLYITVTTAFSILEQLYVRRYYP